MLWGEGQTAMQARLVAAQSYAAFEAVNLVGRSEVRVLDIGCLDGFGTQVRFAPYESVKRVVGIDPLPDAIAQAQAAIDDERFSFACVSFENFEPEDDEQFDLVCFSYVMQYFFDPQVALQKAFRLLAPGGFVVVQAIDEGAELSYPDPDNVFPRLFALYKQYALPNTTHETCVDPFRGGRCYAYMKSAGFSKVVVRLLATDTVGKSLSERQALFNHWVCSRRNISAYIDRKVLDEVRLLEHAGRMLFEREDYYFCGQSVVAIAQRPMAGNRSWTYVGPVFGQGHASRAESLYPKVSNRNLLEEHGDVGLSQKTTAEERECTPVTLRPMVEADLGGVIDIEIASFRDPWTPLAFALDLRHNARAYYEVALCEGRVVGYVGWWDAPDGAVIVRIAVDPAQRGTGVGRALTEHVAQCAHKKGNTALLLEVRAANKGARAFYERLGFVESYTRSCYYEDPPDDGVVMTRSLN